MHQLILGVRHITLQRVTQLLLWYNTPNANLSSRTFKNSPRSLEYKTVRCLDLSTNLISCDSNFVFDVIACAKHLKWTNQIRDGSLTRKCKKRLQLDRHVLGLYQWLIRHRITWSVRFDFYISVELATNLQWNLVIFIIDVRVHALVPEQNNK